MDMNLLSTTNPTLTHADARSSYTEVKELSWIIVADDCSLFSFVAIGVRRVCTDD